MEVVRKGNERYPMSGRAKLGKQPAGALMRYPREHKTTARNRVLERGARHAKKHGFRASGMDALAAAAGVTSGALYKHFDGKSDLFAALIAAELDRTEQRYAAILPDDPSAIGRAQSDYLSLQHVKRPDRGCVLPCLTSEVATAGPAPRASFQQGLLRIHAIFERWTGSSEKAWTLIAQNVGAVMLARALRDEDVQQRLLTAIEREGEHLLAERRRPG